MYFLFADETNTQPKYNEGVKFFVYGGLIIPGNKLLEMDEEICRLRKKYGYRNEDSLKFDTNSRPVHLSKEDFAKIKHDVVALCIRLECKLLLYVVLHKIARSKGLSTTIKWGADCIFQKFNNYLLEKESSGMAFVDRMSDTSEYKILTEKFTVGLKYSTGTTSLNKIRLYASSCDNASHFNSVADVVLGTFRYCINRPFNTGAAKVMMKNIIKLLWSVRIRPGVLDPFERGLTFSPRRQKDAAYKAEYDNLTKQLNALLS